MVYRLVRLAALLGVGLGLLAGPLTLPASATGVASVFNVDASLAPDGRLDVKQTITFSGAAPGQVSQKFEVRQDAVGGRQYVQTISHVTASAGGAAVTPKVQNEDRYTTVSFDTHGASAVMIGYTVAGALVNVESGTALRWALLQGFSAQVTEFTGTVRVPAQFSYVKCTAGTPNSTVPCAFAGGGTEQAQVPTFRDGPRGEGEVVRVDIGFPPGSVAANEKIEQVWSLGRAFSADPLPLGIAVGLLVLGGLGLWALHHRAGIDTRPGEMTKAGEFMPTGTGESEFRMQEGIRPGEIGTLVDERVDPIDITASLLDLAVRGHLLIEELPRPSPYARNDWRLTRLRGSDELQPYEQALLDALAPEGGTVQVAELSGRVQESIGDIQDKLYDEMVVNGWYERRPDATRSRWTRLAIAAVVLAVLITVLLAAFTTFGLVGLALLALALGLAFVAQEMPARTAKGSALLAGLGALRSDLLSHPTNQLPPGAELREASRVLPYAVVLGGMERWLDALVNADTDAEPDPDDLTWYHGPADWHLRDLPDSLRNFTTFVSGALFSR
jgi:hypothetical protein